MGWGDEFGVVDGWGIARHYLEKEEYPRDRPFAEKMPGCPDDLVTGGVGYASRRTPRLMIADMSACTGSRAAEGFAIST